MPTTTRQMVAHMCDACGKESYGEVEGELVNGLYLSVILVKDGYNTSDEGIYACSVECAGEAVRQGLLRAEMTVEDRQSALRLLWYKGRGEMPPEKQIQHDPLPELIAHDRLEVPRGSYTSQRAR